MKRPIAMLLFVAALSSCGPAEEAVDGPVVERETVGDTTIVRTISGSVWDAPRVAVEELRIGTLEGPDETMFGRIGQITPDGSGGVYVFDSQVPAIRHFDAEGNYLGQIGREGQGPGEYLDTLLGMAIRGDGRLQVWDPRNGRIALYEEDGTHSTQWSVSSGLFTGDAMLLDDDDHTYVRHLEERPQPGQDWQIGLLHYGPDGEELEPLSPPPVEDPPAPGNHYFKPAVVWTLAPDGSWVIGNTGTYEFDIRAPDGTALRVQREVERLTVGDEEHAAREAMREWMVENQGQFMTTEMTETPRVKPYYHGLYVGAAGRIWVHRYGPVERRPDPPPAVEGRPPPNPFVETKLFDVFERDGTYLGEVVASPWIDLHHLDLDAAWGTLSEDGVTYVVRLRFEAESDSLAGGQ